MLAQSMAGRAALVMDAIRAANMQAASCPPHDAAALGGAPLPPLSAPPPYAGARLWTLRATRAYAYERDFAAAQQAPPPAP
jgi:hypothetical protein